MCDERITLPLKAFSDFPEIYNTSLPPLQAVVEVKMAWRCNTEQWWTARLRLEYAGPIYRKLGYAELHQGSAWGTWTPQLPLALKGSSVTPRRRSRSGPCHPSRQTTSPAWPRTTT